MGANKIQCAPLCVMLTVKDMNKTMAFYRDVLGFTVAERWPENDPACWANLMLGEQSVMIGPAMPVDKVDQMCGQADAETKTHFKHIADAWTKNRAGIGAYFYVKVDDVDAFHDRAVTRGLKDCGKPTNQFYGLRDFWAVDPDGYQLVFYKPIQMSSCQSCGMPLKDTAPGVMYCQYCTNEKGQLKPYAQVLEGTIQGYFMAMQKMPRDKAEKAAKEHLAKMPAWAVKH